MMASSDTDKTKKKKGKKMTISDTMRAIFASQIEQLDIPDPENYKPIAKRDDSIDESKNNGGLETKPVDSKLQDVPEWFFDILQLYKISFLVPICNIIDCGELYRVASV